MRAIAAIAGLCLLSTAADAAFEISKKPTSNVVCMLGVCTSSAPNSVLNVGELKAQLAARDVTLRSDDDAGDIVIAAGFQVGDHALTIDSWNGIDIPARVRVAGSGAVTLTTKDGGADGNVTFSGKGQLTFASTSGQLFVNGKRFVLVDNVDALDTAIKNDAGASVALSNNVLLKHYFTDSVVKHDLVKGTFDGLGHTIKDFAIDATDTTHDMAFFSHVGLQSNVRNLHIDTGWIRRTNSKHTLSVVAALNEGTIRNVEVSNMQVSATAQLQDPFLDCVAGIAGRNKGFINRVQFLGKEYGFIEAHGTGAGIACENSGTIVSSGVDAELKGGFESAVGGLVYENTGTISQSWVKGDMALSGTQVANGHSDAAGLVVHNDGAIETSWTDIHIRPGDRRDDTAHARGAGFVSFNTGTIDRAYVLGTLASGLHAEDAGFVWSNDAQGVIRETYVAAYVSCENSCVANAVYIGTGCTNGTADYWDTAYYPYNGRTCDGLSGLNDHELKKELPAGFDALDWGQGLAGTHRLPYLLVNPPR